jgi:hypothetical protein
MLMYTSCGWFFDEISGIETTQILQYAAKAIQIAHDMFGASLEEDFVTTLATAPSNVLENGAVAYQRYAKEASLDLSRIAAHHAISSLFQEHQQRSTLYCYSVDTLAHQHDRAGKVSLATGRLRVQSTLTLEAAEFTYGVLHFGDHNVSGGVRRFESPERFAAMQEEVRREFDRGHMTEILQLIMKHFGVNNYSIWHLFRDEQRAVMNDVLQRGVDEVNTLLREVYERHYAAMSFMQSLRHKIPGPLSAAAQQVVREQLKDVLLEDDPSTEGLKRLLDLVNKWGFDLRSEDLVVTANACVNRQVNRLAASPRDLPLMERIQRLLLLLQELRLDLDIWQAQNTYFTTILRMYPAERERAGNGDGVAQEWVRLVGEIGKLLHIKVG